MKGFLPILALDLRESIRANVEKTENGKSINSKSRLSIAAALVLAVAVICGGGLWWHRNATQEHDRTFVSCMAAAKPARFRRANTANILHLTR